MATLLSDMIINKYECEGNFETTSPFTRNDNQLYDNVDCNERQLDISSALAGNRLSQSQASRNDERGDLKDPDYVDLDNSQTGRPSSSSFVPYDRRCDIVSFMYTKAGKRRKLSNIQNRYKEVTSYKQLYDWEKQIKQQGQNREETLHRIRLLTFEKFVEADSNQIIIYDLNIRKWAQAIAKELNYPFVASHTWVKEFKHRFNIKTRKVPVSRRVKSENEKLKETESTEKM